MDRPRIALRALSPQVLKGAQWVSDNVLRIGRLRNQDIVLNDASISRRHAEILAMPQGWIVRDLGSTNGTFLNGVRVGRTERSLHHHDLLQCGNLTMEVTLLSEGATSGEPGAAGTALATGAPAAADPGSQLEKGVEASADSKTHPDLDLNLAELREACQGSAAVPAHDAGGRPIVHLESLQQAAHLLSHSRSLDGLLHSILELLVPLVHAEHGAILLADDVTGDLRFSAAWPSGTDNRPGPWFSNALTQLCFGREESLLCSVRNTDEESQERLQVSPQAASSIICVLLRSPQRSFGVLHLDRGPAQEPFAREDLSLADAFASSVALGIENVRLVSKQRETFINTLTALAQAVEMRDHYTGGHTQRVTDLACLLAEELRLPADTRDHVLVGTPLHDIGKIGIHDSILQKPGKLTPAEFEEMKTHTIKGVAILESIPEMTPMLPIVRSHHERWDGQGYPDGLAGARIAQPARIVAVADAFDAMTSDRPYRQSMPLAKAFCELAAKAGSHFDPECVAAFQRLRSRVEALYSEERSFNRLCQGMPTTWPLKDLKHFLAHELDHECLVRLPASPARAVNPEKERSS